MAKQTPAHRVRRWRRSAATRARKQRWNCSGSSMARIKQAEEQDFRQGVVHLPLLPQIRQVLEMT